MSSACGSSTSGCGSRTPTASSTTTIPTSPARRSTAVRGRRVGRGGGHAAQTRRLPHGLETASCSQLGKEGRDVVVHSLGGDEEPAGDLHVAQSGAHQLQHLALAGGEERRTA